MDQGYTSKQVGALTGITLRQLQWWDEQGIVVPARDGRRRLYSMDDLAAVAVIAELRDKGFSLQRVRKVVRMLQREFGRSLVDAVSVRSDCHLLTDGRRVYVEDSAHRVVDILKSARQPIFAVCLTDTVRRLRSDLRGRKRPARAAGMRGARSRRLAS